MYSSIKLETKGAAAVITFNRPEKLNSLNDPMILEFRHALAQVETDDTISGIIITGAGKGFCAGMDMNALDGISAEGEHKRREATEALKASPGDASMGEDYISGFTYLMTVRKPVIAAVNGACAGLGLSIALLSDLRFAADNAKFVTSFSSLGLVAEHGQSWILPRIVGPSNALDLLWSSRRLLPDEAKAIGLINRIFPADELLDSTVSYINELATKAPLSLQTMKQQVYRHLNTTLGESMKETDQLMAASIAHDDFKEGVAAYLEKRPPNFQKINID